MSKKTMNKNSLGLKDEEMNLAERSMIDVENSSGTYNFVENTIEQCITEDIDFLILVLENLKKYKNPLLFRIIPEYIEIDAKKYGIKLNDYAKKIRGKLTKGKKYTVYPEDEFVCSCCGIPKSQSGFYISNSDMYKNTQRFPMCKECTHDIAIKCVEKSYGNIEEAIILMCQKLDIIVIKEILDGVVLNSQEDEELIFSGLYIKKYIEKIYIYINNSDNLINDSQKSFAYSNLGGVPFKKIQAPFGSTKIYDDVIAVKKEEEEEVDDTKKKELVRLKNKWGEFPVPKLKKLDSIYFDWYNRHEITRGKTDELMITQICYEELALLEARENGAPSKTIQVILQNIKTLTEQASLSQKKQDKGATHKGLGSWIKEFERTKPIILKDESLSDVDNIRKMSENISGALARTLLKRNEYTEKMEENLKEFTSSFNINGDSDSE